MGALARGSDHRIGSAKFVNLTTGEQRVISAATLNCGLPSASGTYLAWWCRSGPGLAAVTATVLDARPRVSSGVLR